MEIEVLNALRSPSGVPSHPVIFLVLLVLTWAMHYLAVCVMLGGTALSLYGAVAEGPHWRRLSDAMLDTAKVAVALTVVLGVAPLLFVQVIYDPFWYVSNVISARWALAFIFILLVAYYAMYYRYFSGREAEPHAGLKSLALSLVLLLVAGFIMHVLTSQMLRPELWQRWYAPDGHIDPSGSGLHEYNLFRYGYFISLSIPVTGAWLAGYARYLEQRSGGSSAYGEWLMTLSRRFMSMGGMAALLLYVLWMSTLPETARGFSASVWSLLTATASLFLAACPVLLKTSHGGDYRPMLCSAVAMLAIAIGREALRLAILDGVHGYDPMSYPVNFDGYGTALFFLTFLLLGGPAVAYSIAISWQAGLSQGVYTASPRVASLGRISVVALAVWIAQYFVFGFLTLLTG
jgi:hypothetical protein